MYKHLSSFNRDIFLVCFLTVPPAILQHVFLMNFAHIAWYPDGICIHTYLNAFISSGRIDLFNNAPLY